jgi:uncharacterized protein (DUF362 family)
VSERSAVSIRRADPRWTDEQIKQAVFAAAEDVGGIDRIFAGRRKVLIKPNIGTNDVRLHLGRQVALTDPTVLRATVVLIRRHFDGDIVVGEATTGHRCRDVYDQVGHQLDDLGVRVVDLKDGPFVELPLPSGLMFNRYTVAAELASADAIVSVAKMKSHLSAGATLCLKNLFGMTPPHRYGSPRNYLHAPVRLPRVLVDVAQLFPPTLCVVDGLVGQDGREWRGAPVETGVVMVGTNVVATDATAMRLMGMDPELDHGAFPYHFDRNPIALAAEAGLGSPAAGDVEVRGDVEMEPLHRFTIERAKSDEYDRVRKGLAREIERFQSRREELLQKYAGQYLAIADGEVLGAAETMAGLGNRDAMLQKFGTRDAILLKQVLPRAFEDERLEVYETV